MVMGVISFPTIRIFSTGPASFWSPEGFVEEDFSGLISGAGQAPGRTMKKS